MKKDNPHVAGRPFMYDARRHRAIAALRIEPRVFLCDPFRYAPYTDRRNVFLVMRARFNFGSFFDGEGPILNSR